MAIVTVDDNTHLWAEFPVELDGEFCCCRSSVLPEKNQVDVVPLAFRLFYK